MAHGHDHAYSSSACFLLWLSGGLSSSQEARSEYELLFPPYSGFTVLSVQRPAPGTRPYWVVTSEAASEYRERDDAGPLAAGIPEALPLAPWH